MSAKTVYLAARYSRNEEMRGVRDTLTALGYIVTSRWIDLHGGAAPASCTPEALNERPEDCAVFAIHDAEDLQAADLAISFTGGGGKGGRHVEFGMAAALGKDLVIIGPREHVFHTLPQVRHYDTWTMFLDEAHSVVQTCAPSRDGHCTHWFDDSGPCCRCGDDARAGLSDGSPRVVTLP